MPICVGHGTSVVRRVSTFYVPTASSADVVPQDAAVGFQGIGLESFVAEKILEAGTAYQGVGLLGATATKLLEGISSWQGVGLFSATAQKVLEAGASWQGVGQVSFTAGKVLEANFSCQAVGLIASFGSIIYTSAVVFVAEALVTFSGVKPWESIQGIQPVFGDISESDIVVSQLGGVAIMATSQAGTQMATSDVSESMPAFADVAGTPATTSDISESTPTYTDVE